LGDARLGSVVFIPRDNWVTLQPIGKTPVSLIFAFNAPSFDRYMRCESVPLGRRPQLATQDQKARPNREGHKQTLRPSDLLVRPVTAAAMSFRRTLQTASRRLP
jgi:hypothetical protein